jgi:hypothetical protein
LEKYDATHDRPAENPFVGPMVGVTNVWNDLTADQLHGPPEDWPACFLTNKPSMLWIKSMQLSNPIVFSTRDGLEGLLQVHGFSSNPPSVTLRYKLVQTNSP